MKITKPALPDSTLPIEGQSLTDVQTTANRDLPVCGTVRLVEPSRDMLYLQLPKHGTEQVIHWQPKTRFLYRGEEVKPDTLHRGQTISVQFSNDAGEKVVTEIGIATEPAVAEATAAQRRALWPKRSFTRASNQTGAS